jgi:hypothetical protein
MKIIQKEFNRIFLYSLTILILYIGFSADMLFPNIVQAQELPPIEEGGECVTL